MFCDDIQGIDLINTRQNLMDLFVNIAMEIPAEITKMIKSKISKWILFIQTLFSKLHWES